MPDNRALRVAEQVKKEISQIISTELKDPRVAAITSITGVEVSRDLRHASVYVSILGSETQQQETIQTLLRAAGFIRSEVGRRIRLRHTPEINFIKDSSMEYGARINEVLRTLNDEQKED